MTSFAAGRLAAHKAADELWILLFVAICATRRQSADLTDAVAS